MTTTEQLAKRNSYQKEWVSRNPEKAKLHRDRSRAKRMSADPVAEKARNAASSQKWREENRELSRARARVASTKWRADNPGKHRAILAARRAKTKNTCPRVIALYEIAAWLRAKGDDVHIDHIVPLSKGGPHTYENLQILTAHENLVKGAR